ncbi:MAG: nucleotidyltransferase domain-containing protein [Deltaproteobacteria bacterium]|nr:nucleotidyltransferase domain-containing protein [Deltaproteobacteria bacterium]
MPVKSLTSSVLKWPDPQSVKQSLAQWAEALAKVQQEIVRIGYFGSYARGDWGVGSDLDLVIVLKHSSLPFHRRATMVDTTPLPVAADVLVYTVEEWNRLLQKGRFGRMLEKEVVWIFTLV